MDAQTAFQVIDGLEYRKSWGMSAAGDCLVVTEEWLENGAVVRHVEHNYLQDNPPVVVEPVAEPESDVTTTADVAGVQADGSAG